MSFSKRQYGTAKILVVDDDEQIRTSLVAVLEFNESRMTTASSVGQALHLIDTEPFDVLLSDLHMPGSWSALAVAIRSGCLAMHSLADRNWLPVVSAPDLNQRNMPKPLTDGQFRSDLSKSQGLQTR